MTFVDGCNQEMQAAKDMGATWVLITHNDTTIASNFFTRLCQAQQDYLHYPVHQWRFLSE